MAKEALLEQMLISGSTAMIFFTLDTRFMLVNHSLVAKAVKYTYTAVASGL